MLSFSVSTLACFRRYVDQIYQTNFQGVSGIIKFNRDGDRSGITDIKQFSTDDDEGYLKPVRTSRTEPPRGEGGGVGRDSRRLTVLDSLCFI